MKAECGCEVIIANNPTQEVKFEEGENHSMIFCDQHQREIVELIENSGGIVRKNMATGAIQAEELTLRALNAIEDFMLEIVKPLIAEKAERRLAEMN